MLVGVLCLGAACAIQRGESHLVTADSIATLQLDRPLGELRGQVAHASDTAFDRAGKRHAGVAFHYPDLLVVASQARDSLDPAQPADAWTVTGCGARLPEDVPVCASWQEMLRTYGSAGRGTSENGRAIVWLCQLPGLQFELDVSERTASALDTARNLEPVRATARVTRVFVSRDSSRSCSS